MKKWLRVFSERRVARERRGIVALLLVVAIAVPGQAQQSFDEGFAAYERGDYVTAFQIMKTSAEQGYATAQIELGHIYRSGVGVTQNYGEALKWFRKAAEQGHMEAQSQLGLMYQIGWAVEQDYSEAANWYRKAAELGSAEAQAALGYQYYKGQGVPQDYIEAVKLFRRAAEQGDGFAQHILGIMYQNGEGTSQDYGKAAKWYREAAEQGDAEAQAALGLMYGTGQGVSLNYVQAHLWLNLAAANQELGDVRDETVKNRENIERRMTPAQVTEAQRRVREWKRCRSSGQTQSATKTSPQSSDVSRIKKLQTLLATLDYSPGPADGVLGPKTHAAIAAFKTEMEKKSEPFESSEKATLKLVEELGLC